MTAIPPMPFRWSGEAMEPLRPRLADQHYTIGEVYRLENVEERSHASHGHYFACVGEAFANLREDQADRWASSEHLRRWALIKAAWRDERSIVCGSKAEALRIAAFIKPMDEFAIVTVSEAVVTVYTAKSQSKKAMGAANFQKSKDDVLAILSTLIEVAPAQLEQRALEHA